MTAILVQNSMGRVILHSICAARDHKVRWHWAGIMRELFPHKTPLQAALDHYTLRWIVGLTILVCQFC